MLSPGGKMKAIVKGQDPENFAGGYTEALSNRFHGRFGNIAEDPLNFLQHNQ
jgi:hypothetical protein